MTPRWLRWGFAGALCAIGAVFYAAEGDGADERFKTLVKQQNTKALTVLDAYFGRPLDPSVTVEVDDAARRLERNRAWLEKPKGKQWLEARHLVMRKLGWAQPGSDPVETELARRKEAGGWYEEDTKRAFVVARDPPRTGGMLRLTVTHELVHARRDQDGHYDKRPEVNTNWSDADLAFRALVEGDATLIAYGLMSWDGPVFDGDPVVEVAVTLLELLKAMPMVPAETAAPHDAFPYVQGLLFAGAIYRARGRAGLDAAFKDPPVSTEQILHPEKYLAHRRDDPSRIEGLDLSKLLGEEWTVGVAGTLGEFDLKVLFVGLGRERTTQAAAGWDGSRFRLYTKKATPALMALYTTWDEEMDAVEFALAWCDWAGGRAGDQYSVKTTRWPAGEKREVQGVDGLVVTARRGNDVVVLDGIPAGMDATPLLTSVWNTTRNRKE